MYDNNRNYYKSYFSIVNDQEDTDKKSRMVTVFVQYITDYISLQ